MNTIDQFPTDPNDVDLLHLIESDAVTRARSRIRLMRAYDVRALTRRTAAEVSLDSIVQHQFAEEQDVNTIVRRFGLAAFRAPAVSGGVYGDFTGINDYDSALSAIERLESNFMNLPAPVRESFDNDPGAFLRWTDGRTESEIRTQLNLGAAPVLPSVPGAGAIVAPTGDADAAAAAAVPPAS